ncbi:MAG: tRNA dihydrouridine synthase DusB [Armatimonadota bacterium]|nr:tRNA dihydrouridine synthase DusB [Armatimonadota bacterium]
MDLVIGGIRIDPPLVLAPMAGVTNHAFRIMCKRAGGCGLVCTEMFSAYAIKFRDPGTKTMIDWTDEERPVCAQVFGGDPETVAIGAKALEDAGADIVDINMGCPVPKVVRSGSGAALLKDLPRAKDILVAAREAVSVPLTVKMRLGWKVGEMVAVDLAQIAEECGVNAVTVHGRFAVQTYSDRADWGAIAVVRKSVGIPVIANGDIGTPEDAVKALEITGCSGLMIGRAARGDPWIFQRISRYMTTGEKLPEPTPAERLRAAIAHAELLCRIHGERRAAKEMRGHLIHYIKGISGAAALRNRIMTTESMEELLQVLRDALARTGESTAVHTSADIE